MSRVVSVSPWITGWKVVKNAREPSSETAANSVSEAPEKLPGEIRVVLFPARS